MCKVRLKQAISLFSFFSFESVPEGKAEVKEFDGPSRSSKYFVQSNGCTWVGPRFGKGKSVQCAGLFRGSEGPVLFAVPLIVCLFRFPCGTLIGCLNFICLLLSIASSVLGIVSCVCRA